MKICKRCFQEFDENEYSYDNPAEALTDIFLESAGAENSRDVCPPCREELGMSNLMGFGQ
ncbi:MAG: hypothetical protein COX20_02255 [Desulfobacterales bacterium CG23_combo_of_CG06-09_8_20_14_all_52_9]|nr:MAG: hypothetical protein COX20_02255 [Desulfobacterales bacterium CG23_combo_of_CG06-09_8_20_14_all_52_9]